MGGEDGRGQQQQQQQQVNRCLVYCRVRPDKPQDYEDGAFKLLNVTKKQVIVKDEKKYDFDGAFPSNCTQEDIFDAAGRPCVMHCLNGFRASIMAYGQTGTGKTFTLCNTRPGQEGVVPRAAHLLFDHIAKDNERAYTVEAQFVQIYRDHLGDLLTESGRDKVDITFDKEGGVTLPGSTSREVTSAEELLDLFAEGDKRRVTTATAMNPESSRGHSALLVWVSSASANEDAALAAGRRLGKLTIIDLAGYERFSKTGISNANPIMKDEAKTINASLLALGHVVSSLSNGDRHIPWRNAKLTRLLQDSIGGRSRTTIILTVGPSSNHLHESTNSLQFGQRAMAVKVQSKVTEVVDHAKLAARLQQLLEERDKHIDELQLRLAQREKQAQMMFSAHDRDLAELRERHDSEIERLRTEGASEEKLRSVAQQQEVERDNLIEQQRQEVQLDAERRETEAHAAAEERAREADERAAASIIEHMERAKMLEAELAEAHAKIQQLEGGGGGGGQPAADVPAGGAADHEGDTPHQEVERPNQGEDEEADPHALIAALDADLAAADRALATKHEVTVELQLQLERVSGVARERAEEIQRLVDENETLQQRGDGDAGGAARPTAPSSGDDDEDEDKAMDDARKALRRRYTGVDEVELEAARAVMDAEMASKDLALEEMTERVQELEQLLADAQQQQQGQRTPPNRGAPDQMDQSQPQPTPANASFTNASFTSAPMYSSRARSSSRGPSAVPALGRLPLSTPRHTDPISVVTPGRGGVPMTARRRATVMGGGPGQQRLEAENEQLRERVELLEGELADAVQALEIAAAANGDEPGSPDACAPTTTGVFVEGDRHATTGAGGRSPDPDEALEIQMLEEENSRLVEEASDARARLESLQREADTAKEEQHALVQLRAAAADHASALAEAYERAETATVEAERAKTEAAELREKAKQLETRGIALQLAADDADERVEAAEAAATAARRERATALQGKETLLTENVQLKASLDHAKSDADTAAAAAAEKYRALRDEVESARAAARTAMVERDAAQAEQRALEARAAAAEKAQREAEERGKEAKRAAETRVSVLVDDAVAEAEEKHRAQVAALQTQLDSQKLQHDVALAELQDSHRAEMQRRESEAASAASQAAPSPPPKPAASGASAAKVAELQSKIVVAQRQAQQHKDEWAAAAARHKEAEKRLVALHEQNAAAMRSVVRDRDAAEDLAREAKNSEERLVGEVAELKLRIAELEEAASNAKLAAADASVRAVGERNAAVVERVSKVMSEQQDALLSHLQNALFSARNVAGDAATLRAEREALVAVIKALRAKYSALQASAAQLCGHIAECHAVMRTQREDLTQRLNSDPLSNPSVARDLAAMLSERDEALHSKDHLIVDLSVELEELRKTIGGVSTAASEAAGGAEGGEAGADDSGQQAPGSAPVSPRSSPSVSAGSAINFLDWTQYREQLQLLERNLHRRVDDANRATIKFQILREQLERMSVAPATETLLAEGNVNRAGAGQLTREQLAAETSIDTNDLQLLLNCKDAEISVYSHRLEQRERALSAMTDHVTQLRKLLGRVLRHEPLTAPALPEAAAPTGDGSEHAASSPRSLRRRGSADADSDGEVDPRPSNSLAASTVALEDEVKKALAGMVPETSARDQLESMLMVTKALRKQNGIINSQLCDRGALLRHFAWLLVHHQILPANYDINSIAGDQSTELRLAFAERDEELFLKDQSLLQRSAEVLLLEQSVRDLAAQLETEGIRPIRPVTRLGDSVIATQRQTQRDMLSREQSRAKLHEKHALLLSQTQEVDAMLMAYTSRLDELEEEVRLARSSTSAAGGGKANLEAAEAQLKELSEEVMELRVQKDQLANALSIVDAQCSAHEDEVRLLRQVLAQSTRAVVELQQQRGLGSQEDLTASFGGAAAGGGGSFAGAAPQQHGGSTDAHVAAAAVAFDAAAKEERRRTRANSGAARNSSGRSVGFSLAKGDAAAPDEAAPAEEKKPAQSVGSRMMSGLLSRFGRKSS